jgi:hypothetical protein
METTTRNVKENLVKHVFGNIKYLHEENDGEQSNQRPTIPREYSFAGKPF